MMNSSGPWANRRDGIWQSRGEDQGIKGTEFGNQEDRSGKSRGRNVAIKGIGSGNQSQIRWNPVGRWIGLGISRVMRQIRVLAMLAVLLIGHSPSIIITHELKPRIHSKVDWHTARSWQQYFNGLGIILKAVPMNFHQHLAIIPRCIPQFQLEICGMHPFIGHE
jgi:hypothetical protein